MRTGSVCNKFRRKRRPLGRAPRDPPHRFRHRGEPARASRGHLREGTRHAVPKQRLQIIWMMRRRSDVEISERRARHRRSKPT